MCIYIILEGIDGCGKSSQQFLLKQRLINLGYSVYTCKEPTEDTIGMLAKSSLNNPVYDPFATSVYMAADRMIHIKRLKSISDKYDFIITDRSFISNLAYQVADSCSKEDILEMNNNPIKTINDIFYSFMFYFDISVEESIRRLKESRDSMDIIENSKFLTKVKNNYDDVLTYINEFICGYSVIDSELPITEITDIMVDEIIKFKNMKDEEK